MKKQVLLLLAIVITAISTYATAPTITSFSPASGPIGTLVTITGTNLNSPTAFTIGGKLAIVVSNTGTILVGMVMPGAATGAISVTTSGGTATGSVSFTVTPSHFPSTQQGFKLAGTGAVGTPEQGLSVSISADGNTAIVGGPFDNIDTGAVWVYTRSGVTWTQQGPKLVGTGAVNNPHRSMQGCAVSLSADGNTAIVGGWQDSSYTGAAWVFFRTGTTWTQQGHKLVGTGAVGFAHQGSSVSLSADGNTAIVGGPQDNGQVGAVWVYTRSGGIWTQQGSKLVGTGAIGSFGAGAWQGNSVALSADGNTALVGGNGDNTFVGAAWVYTRSGTTWSQQGSKLVGTGAVGPADQGVSVSLSADGNTAIVGGYADNSNIGAAWIYTRSGTTWTQQGSKLLGTGAISSGGNGVQQGYSVSISADGNTAIVGGINDNNYAGAAWVYTRSGTTWTQQGPKLVGTGAVGSANQGFSVSLSANSNTAIVGGYNDNGSVGAAWVFSLFCSPDSLVITQKICQGDTFTIGNKYYTASNTYRDTLLNAGGCDSVIILYLTVNPLPVVTFSWDSLATKHDLFAYSPSSAGWCPLFFPTIIPLVGGMPPGGVYSGNFVTNGTLNLTNFSTATNFVDTVYYTFTDSNRCSVKITDSIAPTSCDGIQDVTHTSSIHLYPNPNTGSFTLQTSQMHNAAYTISDMIGQTIKQETITSDTQIIDMGAVPTGIYMLSISGTSEIVKFAVMR